MKENNEIVQIGDNDSGRLIKLIPMGIGSDDISLDHRTLISEIAGIFNTSYFDKGSNGNTFRTLYGEYISSGGKKVREI